jgi:hypothetical protein
VRSLLDQLNLLIEFAGRLPTNPTLEESLGDLIKYRDRIDELFMRQNES